MYGWNMITLYGWNMITQHCPITCFHINSKLCCQEADHHTTANFCHDKTTADAMHRNDETHTQLRIACEH